MRNFACLSMFDDIRRTVGSRLSFRPASCGLPQPAAQESAFGFRRDYSCPWLASVIGPGPPRATAAASAPLRYVEKMLLRAEAVVGYAPKNPGLYSDLLR